MHVPVTRQEHVTLHHHDAVARGTRRLGDIRRRQKALEAGHQNGCGQGEDRDAVREPSDGPTANGTDGRRAPLVGSRPPCPADHPARKRETDRNGGNRQNQQISRGGKHQRTDEHHGTHRIVRERRAKQKGRPRQSPARNRQPIGKPAARRGRRFIHIRSSPCRRDGIEANAQANYANFPARSRIVDRGRYRKPVPRTSKPPEKAR